jgi:Family of unknown function (DUF5519)
VGSVPEELRNLQVWPPAVRAHPPHYRRGGPHFPREIHDALISDGRARPHAAGFANVVSYRIRELEDVAKVVELFRMSYERAKETAERRRQRTEGRYSHDEEGQRSA